MKKIPIIRRQVHKDYLLPTLVYGPIMGLLIFLLMILNNSFKSSLIVGFSMGIVLTLIIQAIGFLSEEYYNRKSKIKKLRKSDYDILGKYNLELNEDLCFEGTYRNFYIKILPLEEFGNVKKAFDYFVLETYYEFESDLLVDEQGEIGARMSGDYFVGKIRFSNNCASLLPKEYTHPDFGYVIDELINICEREKLIPITKGDWHKRYGMAIENQIKEEEEKRTKRILKIGKLDIKYVKPKK